jgi:tRNA-splicing ligase RtcB (3'-phosphate/5'-hydroxy nucleic acid ligase)
MSKNKEPKEKLYTLERIDEIRVRIPKSGAMNVEGLVFINEELMPNFLDDNAADQVYDVACLPGIVGKSLAMSDVHKGYGFTIGGVAAFGLDDGIVSPGGVGYDINCGVGVLVTPMMRQGVEKRKTALIDKIYELVPCGVGSRGPLVVSREELKDILRHGVRWARDKGYGHQGDERFIEDEGCLPGADPDLLSDEAIKRGLNQLGTLGSGNHFLEIQVITEVYDKDLAKIWGLALDQVAIMIHSGSRGLGHQVCGDFLKIMKTNAQINKIHFPDNELAFAPLNTEIAQNYLGAMAAAANYAYVNRMIIRHRVEEAWKEIMKGFPNQEMRLLYDVCHNIAKKENHLVDGVQTDVMVHRKGATRALPKGHPLLPHEYLNTGQPVLVPGSMESASYILVGEPGSLTETFGSTCHGAGRAMSRGDALRKARGNTLKEKEESVRKDLEDRGIYPRWQGDRVLAEEYEKAYKDVNQIVTIVEKAGIARRVVKLEPIGVVKG